MLTAAGNSATLGHMQRKIVLCVGLTPAWQEIMEFAELRPGEVNRTIKRACCAAGKGPNVARALKTLGGVPLLLGFAGGHTSRPFAADLRRAGVSVE
jgi:fructose-1-phosphate kinase PfkB-like protein